MSRNGIGVLRAVFDQSWNLLDEPEQALLSHLAVFRAGCTLDAAIQVAGATLPSLITLVDKSLVRQINVEIKAVTGSAVPGGGLEARFVLLEPIREYALEQLALRGENEALQRTHALFYLALAEAAAKRWNTLQADEDVRQLSHELDNLRTALQWACDAGDSAIGLRLARALWKFWRSYGHIGEGRVWLEQLLALSEPNPDPQSMVIRRDALTAAAWLASDQHDYEEATRLFAERTLLRDPAAETGRRDRFADQRGTSGAYQRAVPAGKHAAGRCIGAMPRL